MRKNNKNQAIKLLLSIFVCVSCIFTSVKAITSYSNSINEVSLNNISIDLFDYTTGDTEYSKYPSEGGYNSGINKEHEFKFVSDSGGLEDGHMNKWTGGAGNPNTNIIESELVKGYPKLKNGESLAYLFNEEEVEGKESFMNTQGLLVLDENGYYSFNSDITFAQFDKDINSFNLKNVIQKDGTDFPVFYPFDTYDDINAKVQNNQGIGYYSSGKGLTDNYANHYFGMVMETEFYKLKDGQLNGEDMIFEFSGDDDAWVFIDDKLVLDLGGIHNQTSGSINFSTGEVLVTNTYGTITSQKNIYSVDVGIDNSDYSEHIIKFFYLERGSGPSNCKLMFNIPTIPDNSVIISKEVFDSEGNKIDSAKDVEFEFNIRKNDIPLADTEFIIYDGLSYTSNSVTDENGNFYLKDGQAAVFSDFPVNEIYEVTEIGYYLNGYDVNLNGQELVIKDNDNNILDNIPSASSGELSVEENQSIVFRNIIEKTASLTIKKEIDSESFSILNEEFSVKIDINGTPFKGDYTLNSEIFSTSDGKITMKKDDVVVIDDIPYGSLFHVMELAGDAFIPAYSVIGGAYDVVLPGVNEEGEVNNALSAQGLIGGNCTVDILNKEISSDEKKMDLTVEKQWIGDNPDERPDSITFDLYKNNVLYISDVIIKPEDENWSYTFHNLEKYSINEQGNYYINNYSVIEKKIGDTSVSDNKALGYVSYVEHESVDKILIRNSQTGTLVIRKTINDANYENGDPVFWFRITDKNGDILYRSIRFSEGESFTKQVVVEGVPIGECTVEELNTMRYTAKTSSVQETEIVYPGTTVEFRNIMDNYVYYSDTEYIRNHFVIGEKLETFDD